MFGPIGWTLLVLSLGAAIFTRHDLAFLLGLVLATAAGISHGWGRRSLDQVTYRRTLSASRAAFGDEIDLTIEIDNRKLLPLAWLEASEDLPMDLAPVGIRLDRTHRPERGRLSNILALRPFERVRRRFRIRCARRGAYLIGPSLLRSGDLFGAKTVEREVPETASLVVYPRIVPLADLGLPARQPLGDLRTQSWIYDDPTRVHGVRDYRPSDEPRRIHWGATARAQSLQVKIFEASTTQRLAILLNLATAPDAWWSMRFDSARVEQAISVAGSIAVWALDAGYPVGLSVNSRPRMATARTHVPVGRGPGQAPRILEALAHLPSLALEPFDQFLDAVARQLSQGTVAVVVSAVCDDAFLGGLRRLRRRGHAVVLVLVGDDQPEIQVPGVLVRRVAASDA